MSCLLNSVFIHRPVDACSHLIDAFWLYIRFVYEVHALLQGQVWMHISIYQNTCNQMTQIIVYIPCSTKLFVATDHLHFFSWKTKSKYPILYGIHMLPVPDDVILKSV